MLSISINCSDYKNYNETKFVKSTSLSKLGVTMEYSRGNREYSREYTPLTP